ncbi:MAG TPA: transposase [Pyrinomonadaceae bacterium]|jgi:hypothetical protein|nr:transposase [Pyrinomonadaceae bacterium]
MIWLSPEQLKDIGVSKGILHRNGDNWRWRETGVRGRNGKPVKEALLESLPPKLQDQYLRKLKSESEDDSESSLTTEQSQPADLDRSAGDGVPNPPDAERRLVEAVSRYEPGVRNAFLAEATRLSSIVEKYEGINPKRLKNAVGKHEFVAAVMDLCQEAQCTDPAVLAIEPSRGKPKSPHTLNAWITEYRELGLAAFLRKPATPTGKVDNRLAEISAEAIEWIEKNVRKYPSPKKLHDALKKAALPAGWSIPSYGWIYRKYETLPKIVKTLWFEGTKAYTGKHAPFTPRDYRDLAALQILVGDHSVRDVTVMLPDGTLTRPWLTLWQDMRTGLIWGSHLDLTPSSNTIGLAYVDGVRNFGAQPLSNPDADFYSYLYTDQGKDYRCKQLTGETLVFKNAARIEGGLNVLCTQRKVGFMEELGLKHLMARGYNAREKPVERTHKDISEWEKNTFENEYCGKGTEHKPERWQRSWARHQKLLKKVGMHSDWLRSESPFMMIDDYRDAIAGWILEYNRAEHTRAVLGGAKVVPIQEYERLYTTRYEISDDALALLLMKADRRTIGKNGVQFFQSNWFFLHEAMSEFKGQDVEIRYTDGDWERIWAVLPNGQVIEASAVGNSGVLNRNKKTMGLVAKVRAQETKMARDFQFVQQSTWRGESVEDRVAAQLAAENPEPPEAQRKAVNASNPKVITATRFDLSRATAGRSQVTADQVEKANVVKGIFGSGDESSTSRIKDEWED